MHGCSFCPGYDLYLRDTEANCLSISNRCNVKLFKSTDRDCVLFPPVVTQSDCCVVTHSDVCTLCIVVGNRKQCLLYVFICCMLLKWGARIACWLECWTHDWKVVSLNPRKSGRRMFFPRVKFVCWLLFVVRSIPVLLQWHVKDSGHSARSAGGRLHLNMHTPMTPWSRSGPTMPLSRRSVGTYQETNSHATCQGTIGQ